MLASVSRRLIRLSKYSSFTCFFSPFIIGEFSTCFYLIFFYSFFLFSGSTLEDLRITIFLYDASSFCCSFAIFGFFFWFFNVSGLNPSGNCSISIWFEHLVPETRHEMNPRDKCKLFAATVESVLAYGTETWRMSKTLEATLDRNKFLRSAFNIKWNEFVTNERSFELAQCEKLTGKVRSKRIQFAGHCFERTNEKISKNSYRKPIQAKTEVFHVIF